MKLDRDTFRLHDATGIRNGLLALAVVGLALSLIGYFTAREQFFYSLLTSWVYWLTIGFGAWFFVMLHHLVSATWSVVIRRLVEAVMVALPLMFVFFLILGLSGAGGLETLYGWANPNLLLEGHAEHLLHEKAPWLNPSFFFLRTVIYAVIIFFITRALYRLSLRQDRGHSEKLEGWMKNLSGPGMVLFVLTLTLGSFDWIMSLDFKWYSTILGVYVFSGAVIAVLSFVTLIALFLRSRGMLGDAITVEHYHDLGKLIFAFVVFWAYIAFSQFFLIWYGNIPEETDWYVRRFEGSWGTVGLLILFGHFVLPFLVLLSRVPKRRPAILALVAIWMLAMHWVDLHWLIMPALHEQGIALSWLDAATFVGVGGCFLWLVWSRLAANPLVPIADPKLKASMSFLNS